MARRKQPKPRTAFDEARDELFSHIHRCGVLQADAEHQREWMDETIQFMTQRYPELDPAELRQLEELGMRFCQPVDSHRAQPTADSEEDANAA